MPSGVMQSFRRAHEKIARSLYKELTAGIYESTRLFWRHDFFRCSMKAILFS